MPKLEWGSPESRYFESGLDRGVLYTNSNGAVPWNGLVKVSDETTGGDLSEYHMDGVKYLEERRLTYSSGTIEAFTYPEEFEVCDGTFYDDLGFGYHNQAREPFGLSYRTLIGNGGVGLDVGYKIHLVYNALAAPNPKEHSTINSTPEAETFTWAYTTTPIYLPGRRPSARFTIDSTKVKSDSLSELEKLLYGSDTSSARLPTPEEIKTVLSTWEGFQIEPATSTGLAKLTPEGHDDLSGNIHVGIMTAPETTRLTGDSTTGIYRLG